MIALFFRRIRQTPRIIRFMGTSKNAVRTQVAVALITYLLLHLASAVQSAVPRRLDFVRPVQANLMHRRDVGAVEKPDIPPPLDPRQVCIAWGVA